MYMCTWRNMKCVIQPHSSVVLLYLYTHVHRVYMCIHGEVCYTTPQFCCITTYTHMHMCIECMCIYTWRSVLYNPTVLLYYYLYTHAHVHRVYVYIHGEVCYTTPQFCCITTYTHVHRVYVYVYVYVYMEKYEVCYTTPQFINIVIALL